MTKAIQQKLSDSKKARWTALIIVSVTMMFGYFFTDVMSPLEPLLTATKGSENGLGLGWTSSEYGWFSGAYGLMNVYLLLLFFGGIILDKFGIRFTGLMSTGLMFLGAVIKYWATANDFGTETFWVPFGGDVNAQVAYAGLGFAIYGVGCEIAGITVSKVIVKWFTGHELALAMGLQVALARIGTAVALSAALPIAIGQKLSYLEILSFKDIFKIFVNIYYGFINSFITIKDAVGLPNGVSSPVCFGAACLCIGMISFIVYNVMDRKEDKASLNLGEKEEGFKFADLRLLFGNLGFWYITLLCLMFYGGVFPFLKFATKLMVFKYGVEPELAGLIPAMLPFGTIFLTPFFGGIYDKYGKGATLMIIGSILLTLVHVVFALPLNSVALAIIVMIILGIAFGLVPSAMWPSVPKIIPMKLLGTAYALIFYIQNIGLSMIPMWIGSVNEKNTSADGAINYTQSMTIFASFGAIAIVISILLLLEDKKKGYGLELANVKNA